MVEMSGRPAVSFVMSVCDGERHLRDALDSMLAQTFADFEVVVIDDGSTDSSPQILAAYAARDERVLVHEQDNAGLATSLNRGVAHAHSPLIARLDADDVALPRRLELQSAYIRRASRGKSSAERSSSWTSPVGSSPRCSIRLPTTRSGMRSWRRRRSTPLTRRSRSAGRRSTLQAATAPPSTPKISISGFASERSGSSRICRSRSCAFACTAAKMTVKQLEQQSLSALGARLSWRAREAGLPDPFAETELVDRHALEAIGASEEEMTAALVRDSVWYAKTMSRARRGDIGNELFAFAEGRAVRSRDPLRWSRTCGERERSA